MSMDGQPGAEPWPGGFGRRREWRGTLRPNDLGTEETQGVPLVPFWRCPHRHSTDVDAEQCAQTQGAGGSGRRRIRPARGKRKVSGRVKNWLDVLGIGGHR